MKWLPVNGYENFYEVSNTGLVRSVDRIIKITNQKPRYLKGKLKELKPNKSLGYSMVSLWKDNKGKSVYVHRLVADAFISNPNNLPEVNHIDGNRSNNNVSNLEWVDRQGNAIHAVATGLKTYHNRLSEAEFLELVQDVILGESLTSISNRVNYGVSFLSVKLKKIATKYNLYNEYSKSLKLQRKKLLESHNSKQPTKRVACFTLDGILVNKYESISEASRHLDISSGAISNAVMGKTKTCKGYLWKLL